MNEENAIKTNKQHNHSLEEIKQISKEIKEEIQEIKKIVNGQESCRVGGCNTDQ
jgi:hypothetical protein